MSDIANWDPGSGGSDAPAKMAKLMSTEASDGPETMNGTNKLERFVGKSKKPGGPFGVQGQEF